MYDDTYKLTAETIDDPDFGIRTISYTYDDVGNRLTKTDNGIITTYTYDNNDRLLIENDITYTYDNNGNTLTKTSPTENISYSYDYQNRLIEVDDGVSVVEYAYDTDGMRVQKTVDGNVTNFLLDKNRDYAQVLREYDNSGAAIVDYIYGNNLISQKRSSLTSYYHYDGQLSTRQLTDASANITDGYTYDAFGILVNMFGASENNYLYTGEQYDPNVGFYYLRARYYNQSVGRFLTMDTWAGSIFEPASLHKYLYAEANPVMYIDPSGHRYTLAELSATINTKIIMLQTALVRIGARLHGTLKLHGTAQHMQKILNKAQEITDAGRIGLYKVTDIFYNMSVQTAVRKGHGAVIECLKRPDLIVRTENNVYHLYEVVSKTQNPEQLYQKLQPIVMEFNNILRIAQIIE